MKAITFKHYLLQQIIWLQWLIEPSMAANPSLAKPGCRDSCGNISIPYPFGMGRAECFLHEWFEVVCHDNRPYLRKYSEQELDGEVLDVSMDDDWTITINANNSKVRVCEDFQHIKLASNLSGSPFSYHWSNEATFLGCGSVMLSSSRSIGEETQTSSLGCTPSCDRSKRFNGTTCNGVNCCTLYLSSTVFAQYFSLNFSNLVSTSNCSGYVLFGTHQSSASISDWDPSEYLPGNSMPVVLVWWIPVWMLSASIDLQNNPNCFAITVDGGLACKCPTCVGGNPYLPNGCQGRSSESHCVPKSRRKFILLAVGGTSFGILFLATACFFLYKIIKKRIERKLKEKFFKRNGGLLLQQQLSVDENLVDMVKFFTSSELDKATDYFNENRVLGHGGQGTVYKGMLVDGKIVAVKKSKLADKNQVEQFINEVVVLSQINHRSVVKLLGCCLETEVPLLVYEFIPNGTLYDLIHNENDEFLMSWDMRLRIAIEVSGALAYLHSATSFPIYHRDIKSSNILLDEKHRAKVSDFGISRHVTIDQTHLTTMVKGTFGYLDPEYFQSNQFTEKSDVYSFGVVLVELLTRQKPISSSRSSMESCLSLATQFLISMEEDQLSMMIDKQIMDITMGKQVTSVAMLAQRCLSLNGRKRPTMKEVAMALERIKMSNLPSIVQTNSPESKDAEIELIISSNGISSSTTTNDMNEYSPNAYPLLPDTF